MTQPQTGFSGELPQVELADVLQLHGLNGFSGGISVKQEQQKGVIFFREGQIIHAEHENVTGIDAIYHMLSWQGGEFSCHPNLQTLHATIDMSLSNLLLECHRRLDENTQETTPTKKLKEGTMNKTIKKILPIPGVNFATITDITGHPINDQSDSAARLGAQGHYLNQVAQQLGDLFGAKNCNFIAVGGQAGHCLNFRSHDKSMIVALPAQKDYLAIEHTIRTTLAEK